MSEQISPQIEVEDDSFQSQLASYRQALCSAEQTMQSEFDKAVMTLSGGALGISMSFLKDIVGKNPKSFSILFSAWSLWGLSITCIFLSFATSSKALRRAIEDTDMRMIYMTLATNRWATATRILNRLGGAGFVIGLAAFLAFILINQPK
jgi:hypothetical protein